MDIVSLSTESLIWLSLAIAIASAITSITGMAGGVLMFSAMSVFMPVKPLITIPCALGYVYFFWLWYGNRGGDYDFFYCSICRAVFSFIDLGVIDFLYVI